jgi:hypothetical protein
MHTDIGIVELIDRNGEMIPAELHLQDEDPENPDLVRLSLRFAGKELTSIHEEWFEAMRALRRELEQSGLLLKCYGASRNVYPSPMSRSMGGGHKAYKLRMAEPAKLEDLVSIFDTGPDVEPATVDEQERFFQEWLASLPRPRQG